MNRRRLFRRQGIPLSPLLAITVVATMALTETLSGQSDGLALYVPFDNSLEDIVGNHEQDILTNDILYTDGISNKSLRIPEGSDPPPFEFKTSPNPSPDGFSVAVWFWYAGEGATLLSKGLNFDPKPGWRLWIRDSFETSFLTIQTGSAAGKTVERLRSSPEIQLVGKWTHLAVTFDPERNRVRGWINGIENLFIEPTVGSAFISDLEGLTSDEPMHYASSQGSLLVDELAIWERALNEEEVASLYARGLAAMALQDPVGIISFADSQDIIVAPAGASVPISAIEPETIQPVQNRRWWKDGRQSSETEESLSIPFVDLNDQGNYVIASISAANDIGVTRRTLEVETPFPPAIGELTRPGAGPRRDLFGQSIAVHENLLAVASPEIEQVHLYRRSNADSSWQHFQVLTKPEASNESFGLRVATDGDTIVVADNEWNVFIYEEEANFGQWVRVATEQIGLGINQTINIDVDDGVVVAADFSGNRAIVFERNGENRWESVAILRPSLGPDRSGFGTLLKVSDGVVVISQGSEFDVQTAIYVFEKSDGRWRRSQRIDPPADSTWFGSSMDFNSGRLVIGGRALKPAHTRVEDGTIWIYEQAQAGGEWETVDQLWLENATPFVSFERAGSALGDKVSLSGDRLFSLGRYAEGQDDNLYGVLFDRFESDGQWHLISRIKDTREFEEWLPGDRFAVLDQTLVVGKPSKFSDDGSINHGGVSLFELPSIGNRPPSIEEIGDAPLTATALQPYTATFSVVDPDDDTITAELVDSPPWLTLNQNGTTLTISGTPPEGSLGNQTYVIKAFDSSRLATRYSVPLQVNLAADSAPVVVDSMESRQSALNRQIVLQPRIAGAAPLDISWEKNGNIIPDQTSEILTVTTNGEDDAGIYTIIVTNSFGSVRADLLDLDIIAIENAVVVPGDYPDIQTAIYAAEEGSTILVEAGDYPSAINFVGKNVTVRSLAGPTSTSIRSVTDPAVAIGPGGTIEGFTILATLPGNRASAAVNAIGEGAVIRNNVFLHAVDFMIRGTDASPLIDGNVLRMEAPTSSWRNAVAMHFEGNSSPRITNNLFENIDGFGIQLRNGPDVTGTPQIINNTFINVRRDIELPFPRDGKEDERLIHNNIFFGFGEPISPTLFADERFFDFQSNLLFPNILGAEDDPNVAAVLASNFFAEPAFVSIEAGDYRLAPGSPGIDQGNSTTAPITDLNGRARPVGKNIDIGAFEGPGITAQPPGRIDLQHIELLEGETSQSFSVAALFDYDGELSYSFSTRDPDQVITAVTIDSDQVEMDLAPDGSGFADITIRAESETGAIEAPVIVYRRPRLVVEVPRDYATLYDAVSATTKPTTIALGPGTWGTSQVLDFEQKDIALIGTEGASRTFVLSPVQWLPNPDGAGFAEIKGITFRPHSPDSSIIGIRAIGRYASITDCVFEDFKGLPLNLTFSDNTWRIVERCHFRNNTAEVTSEFASNCLIANNLFENNDGVGIRTSSLGLEIFEIITNNTFINTPGIAALADSGAVPRREIQNNIFHGGDYALTMPSVHTVNWKNNIVHSIAEPYPTGPDHTGKNGNLSIDPLFNDQASGDYRLAQDSPAIDAGSGRFNSVLDFGKTPRVQGRRVDIGAFEFESMTTAPAFAIDHVTVLTDSSVMIGFPSTAGQLYEVEYGNDGVNWIKSAERVLATGNRAQWIDSGQPFSPSHPSSQRKRYYRVLKLAGH